MSLSDLFLVKVNEEFSHLNMVTDKNDDLYGLSVTFASPSDEVSGVAIYCGEKEITVDLGLTHFHINDYDSKDEIDRNKNVVADSIDFLKKLFQGNVIFYGSKMGGYWCYRDEARPRGFISKYFFGPSYTWHGLIEDHKK